MMMRSVTCRYAGEMDPGKIDRFRFIIITHAHKPTKSRMWIWMGGQLQHTADSRHSAMEAHDGKVYDANVSILLFRPAQSSV